MSTIDLTHSPLDEEQKKNVAALLGKLNTEQLAWLSGYLTGMNAANQNLAKLLGLQGANNIQQVAAHAATPAATVKPELTVLFGSRTGNGELVAENAVAKANQLGFKAQMKDMNGYKVNDFKKEQNLMVVVSTYGEGEPPFEAEEVYEFLHSKRAPKLEDLNFTVCGLGDSSYELFCQTGKDFDSALANLGAKRIYDRIDCDLDFEEPSDKWIEGALEAFSELLIVSQSAAPTATITDTVGTVKEAPKYSKQKPFMATVLDRIVLNGKGSSKETLHLELSLEGSGLEYQPGDAIGVFSTNAADLVNQIIKAVGLKPDDKVLTYTGEMSLTDALTNHYEVTILTREVVAKYAKFIKNDGLDALLANSEKLTGYLYGRDIIDLISDFPTNLSGDDLISILRKLPPRLYSISSSLKAYPDEVHITVAAVRYNHNGRDRSGVCSTFLADRIDENSKVPVYIDKNNHFRLPENPDTSVIMVGPGTGVAPFRAFLQERAENGAKGKNWLFFGDQHFTTDFLYQTEWQKHIKDGVLDRLDVAFSRDYSEKEYVQNKMMDKRKELFRWLEEGAHFYICGDMKHMANDVNKTLVQIIEREGSLTKEKAEEYVKQMKKDKRYQTDVY